MTEKIYKVKKHPIVLSGILVFFIILLIFCYAGVLTIEGKSILVCDMYGQYYDFLIGIKKIILEHKNFTYSWNLDMGMSLIGWIAYYVASPFNLLLLLVPDEYMTLGITVIIALKLSAAAMTFGLFAKKAAKAGNLEIVIFSIFYAVSGYTITYFFHIFWLDGVLLLPLVLIEIKKLTENKKWLGLCLVLALLFFSNYYIAYMTGIFAATCYIAYYIYLNGSIVSKKFLKLTVLFGGAVLLAAGLCAVILLPTIQQMFGRLGEGNVSESVKTLNFTLAEFYENAMIGSYTSLKAGKPLIYSGILSIIMIPLYFLNSKVAKREKWIVGSLLVFWLVVMLVPFTNLIMHIGNNPTWFLYRYSYVFCFLICFVGIRQFSEMKIQCNDKKCYSRMKIVIWLNIAFVGFELVKFLARSSGQASSSLLNSYYLWSIAFLFVYLLIMMMYHKKKILWKEFALLLCIAVLGEVIANGVLILNQMDSDTPFYDMEMIHDKSNLLEKQLSEISQDKGFYRLDKNYRICYNDGMAFGYNSISNFTSVYNQGAHTMLQNMGIVNCDWRSEYAGSTVFTNSIFSIKYILHSEYKDYSPLSISQKEEPENYIETNDFWLPVGFMVNSDIQDFNLIQEDSLSAFEMQKKLLAAMTGEVESEKCFGIFTPEETGFENVKKVQENGKTVYEKINKNENAYFWYNVSKNDNKTYYYYPQIDYHTDKTEAVKISTNYSSLADSGYSESMNVSVPFNLELFAKTNSTTDTIRFDFLEDEQLKIEKEWFYYFDSDKYRTFYEKFKQHSLTVTSYDDDSISGEITVGKENHILFLSIPYAEGWQVWVDGKKADKISLCSGSFIGVSMQEGKHEIKIQYGEPFLKAGILISVISGFIFLICFVIIKVKGKIQYIKYDIKYKKVYK